MMLIELLYSVGFLTFNIYLLKADGDGECTNIHLASCVAVFSAFIQILLTWSQHVFCSFMRGSEDHELEYFV